MHVQGEVCYKSLAKHANTYQWDVNQCALTNWNQTNSRGREWRRLLPDHEV